MSGDVNVKITAQDEASEAFRSVSAEAVKLGAVIGTAMFGVEKLLDLATKATIGGLKAAIDDADKLNDMSQKLGMGVDKLAAYKLAAEQSGTSLEAVAQGVKSLSGQMLKHGEAFQKIGINTQDADKAFRQLADVFSAMPDGMDKAALAVKLFGRSGMELIPTLNLGSKGLEESAQKAEKYAQTMKALAPEADKLNDTIREFQLVGQAAYANLAASVVPSMTEIVRAMAMAAEEGGVLMALFVGFGGVVDKLFAEPFKNSIKDVRAHILLLKADASDLVSSITFGSTSKLAKEYGTQYFREATKLLGEVHRKDDVAPKIDLPELDEKTKRRLQEQADKLKKIDEARAKAVKEGIDDLTKQAAKAYEDFFNELNKIENDANFGDMASSKAQQAFFKLQESAQWKTATEERKAYLTQEYLLARAIEQTTEARKADLEWEKEYQQLISKNAESAQDEAKSLLDKAKAAEYENSIIGVSAEKMAAVTTARYDEQIALKQARLALLDGQQSREDEVAAINEQIGALERLKSAEIAKPKLQAQAQAWENFSRDIERSLTDALMRSFESGDSFGQAFVKNLKNLLKTTVLKVAVQAVVSTGMNALGIGGSSSASSGLNILSSANNAYNLFNGGSTLGSAAYGAYNTGAYMMAGNMGFEQAAMLAAQDSVFGAAGTAATLEAAGASSAMASVAAAMPYVAAALALASLFGGSGGGPKTEGQLFSTIGQSGVQNRAASSDYSYGKLSDNADQYVQPIVESLASTLDAMARKLGGTSSGTQIGLGFSYDGAGTANDWIEGSVVSNGRIIYKSDKEQNARGTYATELANEANRVLLAALGSIDLNNLANAFLDSLDIPNLSGEQAYSAVLLLDTVPLVSDVFGKLGIAAEDVDAALLSSLGGFEKVSAWAVKLANMQGSDTLIAIIKDLDIGIDKVGQVVDGLSEAAVTLVAVLDMINNTDIVEQARQASMSTASLYRLQTDQLDTLIDGYDGSLLQAQKIGILMQSRYQTELQYLQQVYQMVETIKQSVASQNEGFLLDTLDPAGQYNYYDQMMQSRLDLMNSSSDPTQISQYGQQYLSYQQRAWNLLTPAQKSEFLAQYTADSTNVQDVISTRGAGIQAGITADNTAFQTSLKTAIVDAINEAMAAPASTMSASATSMNTAASTMNTAANTMNTAANNFDGAVGSFEDSTGVQHEVVVTN